MKFRAQNTLVLLVLLLLSACVSSTAQDPGTADSLVIATVVAQTMTVQNTANAGNTAVALLTETAAASSMTALPPEITGIAGLTPSPPAAPAVQSQTPTQVPAACDGAQFVGNITIPDGSILAPGASFKKTWRLTNIGTCTWTSDYQLVFVSGASLGTFAVTPLQRVVNPGEMIDISLQLTAPTASGSYQGNWMLRNASGTLFGVGEDSAQALSTQIQVASIVSEVGSEYDFTANFCAAEWFSAAGALSCPGDRGDSSGFVTLLNQPVLESGKTYDLSFLSHPNNDLSGWISGRFPYYQVNDGDRFRAEIGCLNASQGCNVTFRLEYQANGEAVTNLGTWRETYDGQTTMLDINLSGLADQDVQFILSVINQGKPGSANAFWHQARIQNVVQSDSPVLIWNRDPGVDETCDELRVYLTGENSASAQAIDCYGSHEELGWASLTSAEVDMLQGWVTNLKTFDAEVSHGSASQGGISWLDFHGNGDANPRDSHIRAMDELAGRLFSIIAGE